MRKCLIIIVLVVLNGFVFGQTNGTSHEGRLKMTNQFGYPVHDLNGIKKNYTKEDYFQQNEHFSFSDQDFKVKEEDTKNSLENINWQYAIFGTCIGRKSMYTLDIDNDGTSEIIASAQPSGFYSSYFNSFWYVLKYNNTNQSYEQYWVSPSYDEHIERILVNDLNNDGNYEIIIGLNNGWIQIYSGNDFSLINEFNNSDYYNINDYEAYDINNNGIKEILGIDNSNIYVFDSQTGELLQEYEFGAYDFAVGQVDEDDNIEIVISTGKVLELNSGLNVEWDFTTVNNSNGNIVELADLDNDNMQEIIFTDGWDIIKIYDGDVETLKNQIPTDLDIDAIRTFDMNNDGNLEIFYGDGQWGSVFWVNPLNSQVLGSIDNPDHGVTDIAVADVNGDNELEVIWGAGWTSTGEDYIHIAKISTELIEWNNVAIDGPFYAIKICDVDSDGENEIVSISYESESGYESGIISIFDAQTKQLEWQSDGTFLYLIWEGVYDINVDDIDNDNIQEIVITSGQTYDGAVWIIDGQTKEIEKYYEFYSEDISTFFMGATGDVDNDGEIEIIASSDQGIYVINSSDLAVEWEVTDFPSFWSQPSALLSVEDVDSDENQEIIACWDKIYIIDGMTHSIVETNSVGYSNFDIIDFDNDGVLEIVASTIYGEIHIIDGETLTVEEVFDFNVSDISNVKVVDLDEDNVLEFVFTTEKYLYAGNRSGQFIRSQEFSGSTGKFNSLNISDINDDGKKEIFFGTDIKIVEFSSDFYSCITFTANEEITNLSCLGNNDGHILVETNGGTSPISYEWSNGQSTSLIHGLGLGEYSVTITDGIGCSIMETYEINQSYLSTEYEADGNSLCTPYFDGMISINIINGEAPYVYNWSNGSTTSTIDNLQAGYYSVTVTDALNCTSSHSIEIDNESMTTDAVYSDVSCYGQNDGYIHPYVIEGELPFTYYWSNGENSPELNNLSPGYYSVTIIDNNQCESNHIVNITQPNRILTTINASPDYASTEEGDGTAHIDVYGGVPPYNIQWSDPQYQTGNTAYDLFAGVYNVTITDDIYCEIIDSVAVPLYPPNGISMDSEQFSVYPNPNRGSFNIDLPIEFSGESLLFIFNVSGKLVYQFKLTDKKNFIEPQDILAGVYYIQILNEKGALTKQIEIIK